MVNQINKTNFKTQVFYTDTDCKVTEKGETYAGTTSVTKEGYTCQFWSFVMEDVVSEGK